ncbi:unnamed protein product [Ilex paraguariensis]|uniref:Transmembrane protein n=1 Tax=Ilex paraguariensis TaxID=185542 RepID=A0ABC8RFB9_9AQUA
MENCWRYNVVLTLYLPLIAILTITQSKGRELRPSEHGLPHQQTLATTKQNDPEMLSFFSAAAPNVPLPEARNTSDQSWWSTTVGGGGSGGGRGSGGGGDHVRRALLVASLVCGVTGVVLLVVAAYVYVFRFKKQKRSSSTPSSDK